MRDRQLSLAIALLLLGSASSCLRGARRLRMKFAQSIGCADVGRPDRATGRGVPGPGAGRRQGLRAGPGGNARRREAVAPGAAGAGAIPDKRVDEALRAALGKLNGKLLSGVISSIARDAMRRPSSCSESTCRHR